MRTQLGAFTERVSNDAWSVRVEENSGSLTSSGTINLTIQLVNRIGFNYTAVPISVNYSANAKIVVEFGDLSGLGEDLFAIAIGGQITGVVSDTVMLALYQYKTESSSEASYAPLPSSVELSTDAAIVTDIAAMTVADISSLPSNPINGMLRSHNGIWYRYDEAAIEGTYSSGAGGYWIPHFFQTPFVHLDSLTSDRGCNQTTGAAAIFPPPKKAANSDSAKVRYWLSNDGSTVLSSGTQIETQISVNNRVRTFDGLDYSAAFSEMSAIGYELVGYYRTLTNTLDTTIAEVGVAKIWKISEPIILPASLDPDYVAVYDFWLSYDQSAIALYGIKDNDLIGLNFSVVGHIPVKSNLAAVYGQNIVLDVGNNLLVTPNRVNSGYGIVSGLDFKVENFLPITGIVPDLANQYILLNGSTFVARASDSINEGEAVRAVVSTEGGLAPLTPVTGGFDVVAGQEIEVTISHPVYQGKAKIREDYPDKAIAGKILAEWHNPQFRVYLQYNEQWYEKENLYVSTSFDVQKITISDLTDFTEVEGGIPDTASNFGADFGLFQAEAPIIDLITSNGILPAGRYDIVLRYVYPLPNNLITKISHNSPPAIEAFSEAEQTNKVYGETLSVDRLNEISPTELIDQQIYLIDRAGKLYLYYWDAQSVESEYELEIVKSSPAVGRFKLIWDKRPYYSSEGDANKFTAETLQFGSGLQTQYDLSSSTFSVSTIENPNLELMQDLDDLRSIDTSTLTDGSYRVVKEIKGELYDFKYKTYYWYPDLVVPDYLEPAIAISSGIADFSPGRWVCTDVPIVSYDRPIGGPALSNLEWIAILYDPERTVRYYSKIILPASVNQDDWHPVREIIKTFVEPTFNADYVGQLVLTEDTNQIYKAIDTDGNWRAIEAGTTNPEPTT